MTIKELTYRIRHMSQKDAEAELADFLAVHTEAAVKATIEDERQQAAAAKRTVFNILPSETAEIREENRRLAKEHREVHEWNMKLVHERYDLGDKIRVLIARLASVEGERDRQYDENVDLIAKNHALKAGLKGEF